MTTRALVAWVVAVALGVFVIGRVVRLRRARAALAEAEVQLARARQAGDAAGEVVAAQRVEDRAMTVRRLSPFRRA